MLDTLTEKYNTIAASARKVQLKGRIDKIIGLVMESVGPTVTIGEKCYIRTPNEPRLNIAEVVGFRNNKILLMPLGELYGVGPGSEVIASGEPFTIPVGPGLKGRIIDGFGNPIDGKGPIFYEKRMATQNAPLKPLQRTRILQSIATGIKSIDALLTLGKGQRVGIFSGSGIGKSILLGMIARNTSADVAVIALVGERGREVREFIEKDLGEEGLARSVVVVVTSDEPALVRLKGAAVATTVAEYFRDNGNDVMLLLDSATRLAHAQREVGLSIGEPPTTKGYPPSVYTMFPRLLERAGKAETGSITAIYTVLVEADDLSEPVSDTLRSILDGHIVLSRRLASMKHYPAVDVLESISRLMIDIASKEHLNAASQMFKLLAAYREAEDLINIGAYAPGSNPLIDMAIKMHPKIMGFLQQRIEEKYEFKATINALSSIMEEAV